MPQVIRMPSEGELPYGPVREFVKFLFWMYSQAGRPTLEVISARIRDSNFAGTASKETIRRMLKGTTVPPRWETTEAVVGILTEMCGWDFGDPLKVHGRQMSLIAHVKRLWNEALNQPRPLAESYEHDPWASSGIEWTAFNEPVLSDDPPF
jgi:hypothetical protein